MDKSRKIKVAVLILISAVFVIVFAAVLITRVNANSRRDSIMEYARDNFPDAVVVGEEFPYEEIIFELDGVRFKIIKFDSDYFFDNFAYERMRKIVREELLDDFFKPRGIECSPRIYFSDGNPEKDDDLTTFKGEINLEFTLDHVEGMPTPHYLGWLYDFYLYWDRVCPSENYTLEITYYADPKKEAKYNFHIFSKGMDTYSMEEFYAAFHKYFDRY